MSPAPSPVRPRRRPALRLGAVALGAATVIAGGCAQATEALVGPPVTGPGVPCAPAAAPAPTEPGSTVVVLAAGRVPSVGQLSDELAAASVQPADAFARLSGRPGAEGGVVVVASPDANGFLASNRSFDLRSDGPNGDEAAIQARGQLDCLVAALRDLPPTAAPAAPAPGEVPAGAEAPATEPDVTTSLARAVEAGAARSHGGSVHVVVAGLSRSSLGGKRLARVDLRDEVRASVLDRFAAQGVEVPAVTEAGVSVRYLAPDEGLPSQLQGGMRGLAGDVCARAGVDDCAVVGTI